ncbi:MAG: WecB/TagA/CpsF family glycosyltransferase [candidate division KSB1 bacterium]|nr:WecB/TagA/CpsF family glycosyltransferase [candidate division KSB1 bacterium]
MSTATRPFSRIKVLGCPVDRVTLSQCLDWFEKVIERGGRCHIVVINAAKVVKARRDAELARVIHEADLIGADGMSIVWASRLLGTPLPGRVNGTDLMDALFELSARKGYRVYLLGARPAVIEKAAANLRRHYPTLNLVGYRHGYFADSAEEEEAVQRINQAKPDILLLGMSTPMKELWVKRHKELLSVPVIHGVGGSFDIVGGVTRRAPVWMQRSGLEWLFRLAQEPRRLWRRYLITNTVFVWLVLKEVLFGRNGGDKVADSAQP